MEKNTVFSKLNIKDYNNELEKILEHKLFSLEVKNLLLSMLYKIENAYADYKTVKVNVLSKRDFIANILNIIKEDCRVIKAIKPLTEADIEMSGKEKTEEQLLLEEKSVKYIVNKEKGEIICYQNEISLLKAIISMGENSDFSLPIYSYALEAAKDVIVLGHNMSQVEVIRDFNGWSWDIVIKQMDNIKYNFVYENMNILANNVLNTPADQYKEFKNLFYELSLMIYMENNIEKRNEILEIYKEKQERLELFENKRAFVQKVTQDKKEYMKNIEQIDKIMNNTELLKQEYRERNDKLPNKEKIFSISHLADKLEKEREELLEKISECNKIIIPKEFIKAKEELEQEVSFLEELKLEEKDNKKVLEEKMLEYIKIVLKHIGEKIDKAQNLEEIVKWIYIIRYYNYIPFNEDTYIKDIKGLQEDIKNIIEKTIKRAYELKAIETFSDQKDVIYLVLKEMFFTKMINLENLVITAKNEDGKLFLEYYDVTTLENTIVLDKENVRIKKKFKLFI